MSGNVSGISFEDMQSMLQQLQRFQQTVQGDWSSVMNQWQNLQSVWQDRQRDRFEPFFESLCRSYEQSSQQCEEHARFLESRMRASEDAANTINL